MTRLEERLRADMRAESEQIKPGSIPALQLPARAHPPGRPRRRGPRHWPAWLSTLAAAAAVTVVIVGTFFFAHIVSGSGPGPSATGGLAPYSGIPPYYAYAVQGNTYSRTIHGTQYGDSVIARYVRIRATASGKVLRTVSPPAPYNAFESFAGAANGRTFVFAANRNRYTKTGDEYYKLDQKTPLKFMILRITPGGHTQLSPLSLPGTLTEAQAPTLALSPDGAKLAVAYGGSGKPAVVQVITLATGQMRQWTSPPPAATPVLGGPGAWTSDGRTLALGQMVRSAQRQNPQHPHPDAPARHHRAGQQPGRGQHAGHPARRGRFPLAIHHPRRHQADRRNEPSTRPDRHDHRVWRPRRVLGPHRNAPSGHRTVAAARARSRDSQQRPSGSCLVQPLG